MLAEIAYDQCLSDHLLLPPAQLLVKVQGREAPVMQGLHALLPLPSIGTFLAIRKQ